MFSKSFSKPTFFLFSLLILQAKISFAREVSPNQELLNQQDWIIRNQQNQLEEQSRQREFNKIKQEQEILKKEENLEPLQSSQTDLESCFTVERARIEGSKLLSTREKKKLIEDVFCSCIDGKKITETTSKINAKYHQKGFVTSFASIPPQNIASGELILQATEGKIEEIIFGKNGFRQNLQKFTAFGPSKNKVLNLNDINQGISQINRLSSNQAIMKIEPGSEVGKSKIIVENQSKFPANFAVSHDNLGNDFSGIFKSGISSNLDNLLSLNDGLTLNYSTNLVDDSKKKENHAFSASYSIPYRYNNFTFDYSHSDYRIQVPLQNKDLGTNSGYSSQRKFTFDRTFYNSTKLRLSGFSSLTKKDAASYQNFLKIPEQQRALTIANVGFSAFLNNGNSSFYLRPSLSKGLKILNAQKDSPNSKTDVAKSQFEVFKLYFSASRQTSLPKINLPISLTSEFDSQISRQTLHGSEQFSIGGYYSVRGFRENFINGDHGYSLRNKASFNLGSAFVATSKLFSPGSEDKNAEKINKNTKENLKVSLISAYGSQLNSMFLSGLNKTRFEPFFDYGYAKKYFDKQGGRLSGTGFRLIFDGKYFSASLTQSWAAHKSKLTNSPKKENSLLYFELSAKCC